MNKILVVVDMQKSFGASNNKATIKEVGRQIKLARQQGWPIIVVEYADNEVTHRPILRAAQGYIDFVLVRKSHDDGSNEIMRILSAFPEWQTRADTFRFVGVNTDACVKYTVRGLAERLPDHVMEVWLPGCNANWEGGQGPFGGITPNVVFKEAA